MKSLIKRIAVRSLGQGEGIERIGRAIQHIEGLTRQVRQAASAP